MKANQKFIDGLKTVSKDDRAMWDVMIAGVFAIIIVYACLNIGAFINGTISDSLYKTFPTTATTRTAFQNYTIQSLTNTSKGFNTNVAMTNIAAQIGIITIPLLMIVYIRRAF